MQARSGWNATFWSLALVGVTPAILALTSASPEATIGLQIGDGSVPKAALAIVYGSLLIVAIGVAFRIKNYICIIALAPLAFCLASQLTSSPPIAITLEASLLQNRPGVRDNSSALERIAALFAVNHHAGDAMPVYNARQRESALKTALDVPAVLRWLRLTGGAERYRDSWSPSDSRALQAKISSLSDPSLQWPQATDLANREIELGTIHRDLDAYNGCVQDAVVNQNPQAPPTGDCTALLPRVAGPMQLERRAEVLRNEIAALKNQFQGHEAQIKSNRSTNITEAWNVIAAFEGRIFALSKASEQASALFQSAIYLLSSFLAIVLYAAYERYRFLPTLFAAVLLFSIPVLNVGLYQPIVDQQLRDWPDIVEWIFAGALPAATFLIVLAGLRLTALAIGQNWRTIAELKISNAFRIAFLTLVYWAPIAALALWGIYVSSFVSAKGRDAVYAIQVSDRDGKDVRPLLQKSGQGLEADIDHAIDAEFAGRESELKSKLDALSEEAAKTGVSTKVAGRRLAEETIPAGLACDPRVAAQSCVTPATYAGYSCGAFDFKCRGVRGGKRVANSAYASGRADLLSGLDKRLDAAEAKVGSDKELAVTLVKAEIATTLAELKGRVKLAIWNAFFFTTIMGLVANLLLFVSALKSIVYIFSRFAFSAQTGLNLAIVQSPTSANADGGGSLATCSFDQSYAFSKPGTYFVRTAQDVSNKPGKIAWPQPSRAFLRRLFSHNLVMNEVVVRDNYTVEHRMTTIAGREFIQWDIPPSCKVYFHFRDFVAMSSTLKLATEVSMHAASLFLGRISFCSVTGPGTLILSSMGKPRLSNPDSPISFRPSRLLGWESNARFKLESELSLVDMYLSDIHLRPVGDTQLVIDSDPALAHGRGAIRFVPAFLLPW